LATVGYYIKTVDDSLIVIRQQTRIIIADESDMLSSYRIKRV